MSRGVGNGEHVLILVAVLFGVASLSQCKPVFVQPGELCRPAVLDGYVATIQNLQAANTFES